MKRYEIARKSGTGGNIGVYEGRDEDEALDAMAKDAGYANFRESCLIVDNIRYLTPYRWRDDLSDADLADLYVEDQRSDYVVNEVSK